MSLGCQSFRASCKLDTAISAGCGRVWVQEKDTQMSEPAESTRDAAEQIERLETHIPALVIRFPSAALPPCLVVDGMRMPLKICLPCRRRFIIAQRSE